MDNFVLAGLIASLLLNAILIYREYSKKKPLSVEASKLLGELTRGKAVVEVRVLDAAGLFYRSPRG
jgi:hypothetical protein